MSLTLERIRAKGTDVERHLYLASLQMSDEDEFYRVLLEATDELLPLVYTPLVGLVCQNFSSLFPSSRLDGRGLFLSIADKGRVAAVLKRAVGRRHIRAIVVTDGQRILGLGDLGADGMGIPIGKLALYSALAGVPPTMCLPVTLDVGCDVEAIRADPAYMGRRHPRIKGHEYAEFVDEFMKAATAVLDAPLIQFEDFGNHNAFTLLKRYEKSHCVFNDDIQGTASVVLGGLLAACRITRQSLGQGTYLLFGAGEAAIGIAALLVQEMLEQGIKEEDARSRIFMIDSKGLVVTERTKLSAQKQPWAQPCAPLQGLLRIVKHVKPTHLIGVGAVPGVFDSSILKLMAQLNERPVIFALSNPTVKSECTAAQAYRHTDGRAIFASGSPFDPLTYLNRHFVPGQCNNSYIFPGVGLAVCYTRATRVTQRHFVLAAHALAARVSQERLDQGCLFPPLSESRDVSLDIAEAVSTDILQSGKHRLPTTPSKEQLRKALAAFQYNPAARQKL